MHTPPLMPCMFEQMLIPCYYAQVSMQVEGPPPSSGSVRVGPAGTAWAAGWTWCPRCSCCRQLLADPAWSCCATHIGGMPGRGMPPPQMMGRGMPTHGRGMPPRDEGLAADFRKVDVFKLETSPSCRKVHHQHYHHLHHLRSLN